MYINTYIHTHIHIHTNTNTHTYTHTHTHTHTIFMYIYIYIYIYNCCSISNDPKCPIGRPYLQTVMDEKITFCEYTTQGFMFYTFIRHTFLFYLGKQGQNCY